MTRKIVTKSQLDDQWKNVHNDRGRNVTRKFTIKYEKLSEDKMKQIVTIEEVPDYLAHNIHILRGYRTCRTTKQCLLSIFWWSNETINMWSHLLGTFFFLGLAINDLYLNPIDASDQDWIIMVSLSAITVAALIASTAYHTFSCKDEDIFNLLLSLDVFGISCIIMAIYMSGLYFALFCYPNLRIFYITTVFIIFIIAVILQIPKFNFSSEVRVMVFCAWALSGVLPTIHGIWLMGGFEHPMIQQLFPRIKGLYSILISAFLVYHYQIPERFFPGFFDYVGSSHQLWHLLILLAFYYWYSTFFLYLDYRKTHGCVTLS